MVYSIFITVLSREKWIISWADVARNRSNFYVGTCETTEIWLYQKYRYLYEMLYLYLWLWLIICCSRVSELEHSLHNALKKNQADESTIEELRNQLSLKADQVKLVDVSIYVWLMFLSALLQPYSLISWGWLNITVLNICVMFSDMDHKNS